MKTAIDINDIIYKALDGVTASRFLHVKDAKFIGNEYITVNSLPFTPGTFQVGFVNVNCHCKDIAEDIPDMSALGAMSAEVIAKLDGIMVDQNRIDLQSTELFTDNGGEHYINHRFYVKILN